MAASMSSFSIAISGLRAAQQGLSTTGHNMANSGVDGYTRQKNIQKDFMYAELKNSPMGLLQYGLGVDVNEIRQIRNSFFDAEYRNESSAAGYYAEKYVTGQEIENIIGELESQYKGQDVINDIWEALNELTITPEEIETRNVFISTCLSFVDKMQDIQKGLYNYQLVLNDEIKTMTSKINSISEQIEKYNRDIVHYEVSGQSANDLRDERNRLLDELSGYLDIDIKEDLNGDVKVLVDGNELIANGNVNYLGLKYVAPGSSFVEPVFSRKQEILPSNSEALLLYPNLDTANLLAGSSECSGQLKGLLVARGNTRADSSTDDDLIKNYTIPRVEKTFDKLVMGIAELLNSSFSGEGTYDLNGMEGAPIFTKIYEDLPYNTLNMRVNPEVSNSDGYNKLGLSGSGDVGDTSIILDVLNKWEMGIDSLDGISVSNYYKNAVDEISIETDEASTYYDEHNGLKESTDNKRISLSGVSLDEELTNMLKYQYAFQAASKLLNVIDSMIDKVVNGMGVVGR